MSLTSLVNKKTRVRDRLNDAFPKPRTAIKADLLVPPAASNRTIVGTAFDYLLRFHLEKCTRIAKSSPWIAHRAIRRLVHDTLFDSVFVGDETVGLDDIQYLIFEIVVNAKIVHRRFLDGADNLDDLIRACIGLAHCDIYYRIGRFDVGVLADPPEEEIKELGDLLSGVDFSKFRARETCLLNPRFGRGSKLIGGADADVLIDDLLIDIKTTSKLQFRIEEWRQLLGYVALNRQFPIGGGHKPVPIRRIGIYFSRYNHLMTLPLRQVLNWRRFEDFAVWFADYVYSLDERYNERQIRRLQKFIQWSNSGRRQIAKDRQRKRAKQARLKSKKRGPKRPLVRYERLRESFRPKIISWLFVADSPPAHLDHFFYSEIGVRNDRLFLPTMRAIYPSANKAKTESIIAAKAEYLSRFKSEGCYMIELCTRPFEANQTQLAQRKRAQPFLEDRLDKLRDQGYIGAETKIVLVGTPVYNLCNEALKDAGFFVINKGPIPLPHGSRQASFIRKLRSLLRSHGRIPKTS